MSGIGPLRIVVADGSELIRGVCSALPPSVAVVRVRARSRQELERAVADPALDAVVCADDLSGHLVGADSLRRLREQNLVAPETALILLVQNAHRDHILACVQARPDAILLKPFSLASLAQCLQRAVARRRQLADLRRLHTQQDWRALLAESRFRQSSMGGGHVAAAQFEGIALVQLGQLESAAEVYQRVLDGRPGLLWAEEALAELELRRGEDARAEERLLRLVASHPSHVQAHELLLGLKRAKGDLSGAQQHLQQLVRYTGRLEHRRELGHLAILNGRYDIAIAAFAAAARAAQNVGSFEDHVNVVRGHLLAGNIPGMAQANSAFKLLGQRDLLLGVIDHIVSGAQSRAVGHLGRAQDIIYQGLRALDSSPRDSAPVSLEVLAVEASLLAVLSNQASERSRAILMSTSRTVEPLVAHWLLRLHDWARSPPEDCEMPPGLRGYKRLLP